ncbi:MAG: cation:proton antiporter [Bacteroidota bacterium]
MSLSSLEIIYFLLSIGVILLFGRGIGELFRNIKQPIIIGEIIAGIFLGPTILGSISPSLYNYLFNYSPQVNIAFNGFNLLALVLLMLVLGLEIDLSLALSQGKAASLISVFGVIIPFTLGFAVSYLFPTSLGITDVSMKLPFSLFIGTALSITALPVVAKTLMDLNLFKTDIGLTIITSAMFNDLIGWIVFSLIIGMLGHTLHPMEFHWLIISIISFVSIVLLIGRKLINYVIPKLEKVTSYPGGIINFIFVLGLLSAVITEYIGIHAIFGAFIMGIAIGDSVHLKEDTREIIQQFVTNIFAPIFFVSIGLKINFITNFDLLLVIIFLSLSVAGKMLGSLLGARLGGIKKENSIIIGLGLNVHGAIEIILGTIALQNNLIQERVFVALVIMALTTSITSAPLMNYFLKRSRKFLSFVKLVKSENVFFTNAKTKSEVIKELCNKISIYHKLSNEKLLEEVLTREELISTGLEKHLAIPHAKVNIPNPLVAVAIHKDGIEFDSLDGLPAKLIILLITPQNDPELQLKLLAEISRMLGDKERIDKLINSGNATEFVSNLNQLS